MSAQQSEQESGQDRVRHVVDFYSRHPISAAQILRKVEASRGSLDGLRPEDLFPHDQDHYGGLPVNDALAARADLKPGMLVVDFCAGLGGPARYLAHRYGVTVTGIDLNPSRVAGARELTQRVGLADKVTMLEGDVTNTPLAPESVDRVVSQEAFLHIPDKAAAAREAHRILKAGGRLVFTDWVTHRPLTAAESEVMWRGIAAQTLQSIESYKALLAQAGFRVAALDDLTADWGTILAERLAMYRKLREETLAAGLPAGDEDFYAAYVQLVALVQARALGG
ncbi:MAG: methyltransferase domain-containing protein, partial [Pseudorhodoplanes sp.]|nr:methyltransferase domain-containing protein [Pseudorhodoplanes sp.]